MQWIGLTPLAFLRDNDAAEEPGARLEGLAAVGLIT
jgi:hypothetical protein